MRRVPFSVHPSRFEYFYFGKTIKFLCSKFNNLTRRICSTQLQCFHYRWNPIFCPPKANVFYRRRNQNCNICLTVCRQHFKTFQQNTSISATCFVYNSLLHLALTALPRKRIVSIFMAVVRSKSNEPTCGSQKKLWN